MPEEFKRPAILEELDSFNTAPIEEAGSIMEGIAREQEGQFQQSNLESQTPAEEPEKKEQIDPYLPLNTSIQELGKEFRETFTSMRRELNDLRSNFGQQPTQQQPHQQQYQQPQYDPEAPVTMAHMQQVVQAYTGVNQTSQEALKNSAKARGYVEFMQFQKSNPDFNMDPSQVDQAVDKAFQTGQSHLVTSPQNWRGFFEMNYAPIRANQVADKDKRIAELEKQLDGYKKKPAAPTTTTPVSPALGRITSRPSAISTPLESQEDVTKLKSFMKKGDFKRFGKDITRLGIAK